MITARRAFLTGLGATLITAPAIVRAGSLMPVKQMIEPGDGVSLMSIEHPMAGLREMLLPPLSLNEESLRQLLIEAKRNIERSFAIRPRYLLIP